MEELRKNFEKFYESLKTSPESRNFERGFLDYLFAGS